MSEHYFFDTSALVKHYHTEAGTDAVDAMFGQAGATVVISRLASVELHSTFAKKVRVGQATVSAFRGQTRRFRSDLAVKKFQMVRVSAANFTSAVRLIRRLGPTANLRTLDALQLAVALGLNSPGRPVTFVSADKALCVVAAGEGLAVIDPEVPSPPGGSP